MRVFFDMDGVLSKFLKGTPYEDVLKEGYFRSLPPQEQAVRAFKAVTDAGFDVYIVSCVVSPMAEREKLEWLRRHLKRPCKVIFVPDGQSKSYHIASATGKGVGEGDFLLDDYTKNLEDFKAAGGTGIKLLNGINDTRGSWQGHRISLERCAEQFLSILKGEKNERNF